MNIDNDFSFEIFYFDIFLSSQMSFILLWNCWFKTLINLYIIYIRNSLMFAFTIIFLNMFFNKCLILFNGFECWMGLNSFKIDLIIDASMIIDFVTTIINICVLIFKSRSTENNFLTIDFRDVLIFFLIERTYLTMLLSTTFLYISIICLYDYSSTRIYIFKEVRKYI